MNRNWRRLVCAAALGLFVGAPVVSCGRGGGPSLGNSFALYPHSVSLAAGAKHDVAAIACENELDLGELLLDTAFIGLMTASGRIDALLGLPAVGGTRCEPLHFTVTATVEGSPNISVAEPSTGSQVLTVSTIGPGEATLHVTLLLDSGRSVELTAPVTAVQADRVTLDNECPARGWGVEGLGIDQHFLPTNTPVEFPYKVYAGAKQLPGYGYFPFYLEGMAPADGGAVTQSPALLTTAGGARVGRITSSVDPAFERDLSFFALSEVDTLATRFVGVRPPYEVRGCFSDDFICTYGRRPSIGDSLSFRSFAKVGPKTTCADRFERVFTSETPAVCLPRATAGDPIVVPQHVTGIDDVSFYAFDAGTCRIRADLVGGSLFSTVEVPIAQGWEWIPTSGSALTYPQGLWSSGPGDVFVVGSGAVQHFDGTAFQAMELPRREDGGSFGLPTAIAGTGPGDVFAVGSQGLIVYYDGLAWTRMDSGTARQLSAVWATRDGGTTVAYATGAGGTVLRFDETGWRQENAGTWFDIYSVWGSGPNDVYAVATAWTHATDSGVAREQVLHRDDTSWSILSTSWDGGSWPSKNAGSGPVRVWGSGPADVWVADRDGVIHFDGAGWSKAFTGEVIGGWSSSADNAFAVTQTSVFHFDGEGWTNLDPTRVAPERHPAGAIFGSSPNEVYVVPEYELDGLYHYRGVPARDGG